MIKDYPLLPFLFFAGALISTATIGLPVFAGWEDNLKRFSSKHNNLIKRKWISTYQMVNVLYYLASSKLDHELNKKKVEYKNIER